MASSRSRSEVQVKPSSMERICRGVLVADGAPPRRPGRGGGRRWSCCDLGIRDARHGSILEATQAMKPRSDLDHLHMTPSTSASTRAGESTMSGYTTRVNVPPAEHDTCGSPLLLFAASRWQTCKRPPFLLSFKRKQAPLRSKGDMWPDLNSNFIGS